MSKPRIIKALNLLQAKVGHGRVDEKTVRRMQEIIDDSRIDFAVLARPLIDDLGTQVAAIRNGRTDATIDTLSLPVMQVKANAAMFGYPLAGNLAHIVLTLLESEPQLDTDILDILDVFCKTLNVILENNLSGSGGDYGRRLESELGEACQRYYAKTGLRPAASAANEALED